MAADGSRLGWDKAHRVSRLMGSEASYTQPGSAVGSHWWEAWCPGQGATPATRVLFPSTSTGQEYLVRRLLEN